MDSRISHPVSYRLCSDGLYQLPSMMLLDPPCPAHLGGCITEQHRCSNVSCLPKNHVHHHFTSSLTFSALHRPIQQFPSRRLLSLYRRDVLHRCECGKCMLSGRNLCGEMCSRWCCGMRRLSLFVSISFRVANECISGVVR